MARQLFTVGYEGTTIDTFVANLLTNNINCLLDIRAFPFSRKPGFSKSQLAERLKRANIRYVHLADLGTPKPIRENLKLTSDYSTFFKEMNAYLSNQKDAIEIVHKYALNSTCCLMCFEHYANQCHRKIVANKVKSRDGNCLQIKHL